MSYYTVTLTISEVVYARARQLAEITEQPVEQILSSRLSEMFDDLTNLLADAKSELAAFRQLSDEALWTIAREQPPSDSTPMGDVIHVKLSRHMAENEC